MKPENQSQRRAIGRRKVGKKGKAHKCEGHRKDAGREIFQRKALSRKEKWRVWKENGTLYLTRVKVYAPWVQFEYRTLRKGGTDFRPQGQNHKKRLNRGESEAAKLQESAKNRGS